jgi:hypothetical protein
MFIDRVVLYKEAKITKTENVKRIQFILSTMWNVKKKMEQYFSRC